MMSMLISKLTKIIHDVNVNDIMKSENIVEWREGKLQK